MARLIIKNNLGEEILNIEPNQVGGDDSVIERIEKLYDEEIIKIEINFLPGTKLEQTYDLGNIIEDIVDNITATLKIMSTFQSKTVKIEKLSDDVFGGIHPNGIDKGYQKVGRELNELKVGYCYGIGPRMFFTSTVTEISEDGKTFKTENSTYSREIIE